MVKQLNSDERSDGRRKKKKHSSHARQKKIDQSHESKTCRPMDPVSSSDCPFRRLEEEESFTFKQQSGCNITHEIDEESTSNKIEDDSSSNPNLNGDSSKWFGDSSNSREARVGNHLTAEQEVEDSKDLTSSKDEIEDLSNIQEWDENEIIPSLDEITADDIQRVKKGMINGRVYDLGFNHIEEIFPAMKAVRSSRRKALPIESSYEIATTESVQEVGEESAIGDDEEPAIIDLKSDASGCKISEGVNDLDESVGIGSFRRFFGGILDCRLTRPHLWVIKRRHAMINFLNPDERSLRKLEGIDEWDIDEPIPPPSQLTRFDRKRIKNGILKGTLYNIGFDLIKKMFRKLKKDPSYLENTFRSEEVLTCPICSKSFQRKYIHSHIESAHTMSLIICSPCRLLLTSRDKCLYHQYRCRTKLSSNPATTIEDTMDSNPSTLEQHKTSMSSGDNSSTAFCSGVKSFERFYGSLSECRVSPICYRALENRKQNTKATDIDEEVFKGLSGIKKWKEHKPIPPAEQLAPLLIKRIKKGMSKGRLYNLGIEHIRKIFPRFSRLGTRDGLRTTVRFKCPLCSKEDRRKQDMDRHIESQHTMNLIVCMNCKTLCLSRRACTKHRCKWD